MHMWTVLWAFWTKGGLECGKRFPGPLWPRTIPSNMLPPEWTFNFSNYQSNAFCHSQPICFNFCRINLCTIVSRRVAKVERRWHPLPDLKKSPNLENKKVPTIKENLVVFSMSSNEIYQEETAVSKSWKLLYVNPDKGFGTEIYKIKLFCISVLKSKMYIL